MDSVRPESLEALQHAVRAAGEGGERLRICGMDSKREWARAWRTAAPPGGKPAVGGADASGNVVARVLEMGGFAGIDLYEPEELVLRAGAGTPMREIHARLQEQRQQLAFEPPDLAPLYGGAAGSGTLGGVVGCNLSGPRRVAKGAARDSVLGIEAVSGRGEVFRSGGRVMKNVTGYDLPKLLTGSHGDLAAVTAVTLKLLPASEASVTLALPGLGAEAANAAMGEALSSPYEVSGAAWLPKEAAGASPAGGERDVALLRLEGARESLAARAELLRGALKHHGGAELLWDEDSRALWRFIGDAAYFALPKWGAHRIWRIFAPPASGWRVEELAARLGGAAWLLDWGGGLAWLGTSALSEDADKGIADFALALGGYAVCARSGEGAAAGVGGGFASLGTGERAAMARVRAAFDPDGVFAAA